jgi:hypothetical protein
MKLDTSQEGLRTLFKPYQILIMEHLWNLNEGGRAGLTSGQAWRHLLDKPERRQGLRHSLPQRAPACC